jgi:HEPN domain-containing protein
MYGAVFHAQQAAQKDLKAFLVWHQIEFPKTHDRAILLKLVSSLDSQIGKVLSDAVDLSPYGVEYRYPGDYSDITTSDARKALDLAVHLRAEIRRRLPVHAIPDGD